MVAPSAALSAAALSVLLAVACAHDLRARRIPNTVVVVTLAAGLARAALAGAAAAPLAPLAPGLAAAALGAAVGLAAWLPLYALGLLGAGDVKLFAAAAAWLGPQGVLPASTAAALAGGVLAVLWVAAARLAPARAPGTPPRRPARLPYGLAVSAGVLAVAWGAA